MNTSDNTQCCFFCKRDLSTALVVQYVAEGPCCSMCLAKMFSTYPPIGMLSTGDWFYNYP
ncbi:hypothetical protein HN385_06075 [archaeon]|jgi:hypothetical protein|nr:hypothetical protein [archaeon]